jgi:NAD(P)-dependent dehydrogenase (short-subunit alcohol dehydrogenase family)
MSKVFGQRLIKQGRGGSIVNISSIAGKAFVPNGAAYAASKAGVQALTACMAREVAEHGIRVNAICPGIIDTARLDDIGRDEAWLSMVKSYIPLGRAGTTNDVAGLIAFLCSDQGAWVTGQSWNIDGGSVVQH